MYEGWNAINFAFILKHELYDRAFRELTNLPFPCMISRQYNEASGHKISSIDERVLVMVSMKAKTIKDLAYPGPSRR